MAIERLSDFIEEQLKRDDLTDKERAFLAKQKKAANKALTVPQTEKERQARLEAARNLGNRMREAYLSITDDETPIKELTDILRYSASELLSVIRLGSSPFVNFVIMLTTAQKSLINKSLFLAQRELCQRVNDNPSIGDFRMQIDSLEGTPTLRREDNARMTFLKAAFPKPPTTTQ